MAQKLYYRVYRQRFNDTSDFEDIVIEVIPFWVKRRNYGIRTIEDESSIHDKLEFRWQTSRKKPDDAYAFRVEIETDMLEKLTVLNKTARRVLRDLHRPSPQEVIDRLERLRPSAERVVYDGRVGGYLQPSRVPPPEIHRWVDGYDQVPGFGASGCMVNALAHVDDGAADKIEDELVRHADGKWLSDRYKRYLDAWRDAGRPVIDATARAYTSEIPTLRSVKAILAGQ